MTKNLEVSTSAKESAANNSNMVTFPGAATIVRKGLWQLFVMIALKIPIMRGIECSSCEMLEAAAIVETRKAGTRLISAASTKVFRKMSILFSKIYLKTWFREHTKDLKT